MSKTVAQTRASSRLAEKALENSFAAIAIAEDAPSSSSERPPWLDEFRAEFMAAIQRIETGFVARMLVVEAAQAKTDATLKEASAVVGKLRGEVE